MVCGGERRGEGRKRGKGEGGKGERGWEGEEGERDAVLFSLY